jgi:hypothetical protein
MEIECDPCIELRIEIAEIMETYASDLIELRIELFEEMLKNQNVTS